MFTDINYYPFPHSLWSHGGITLDCTAFDSFQVIWKCHSQVALHFDTTVRVKCLSRKIKYRSPSVRSVNQLPLLHLLRIRYLEWACNAGVISVTTPTGNADKITNYNSTHFGKSAYGKSQTQRQKWNLILYSIGPIINIKNYHF